MRQFVRTTLLIGYLTSMISITYANQLLGGRNDMGAGNNVTSQYCDITTPNYPAVYTQSASSAWDLLFADSTDYVQVGWYKAYQQGYVIDGVHYFSEYQQLGNDHIQWSTVGPAASSTHGYRNYVQSGYYYCTVDGSQISVWPQGFTATGYQFSEELNGDIPYNAQFAGQASYHAKFANMRIYNNNSTINSPYLTQEPDPNGKSNWINYTIGSSTSTVEFWDARY